MAAETYLHLLGDSSHWLFELSVEAVTGIVLYPIGRRLAARWVARHDKEAHGNN